MLRKAVDVTQVELAEELNGSQHTKQSYEVGRRRIPVSGLPLVAQKLNISLDELFGDRLLRGPKRLCGDKR